MTKTFRMLMLTGALAGAFAVSTGAAAKEITVALASTFTTMDPYDAGDTLSQNSAKSMYEGLFGLDKDMKLKNALATGYEVSKDGLVYTVTLRKGVMFHDGTEFKADAVKANFDRVTNKDNALRRYTLYMNIAKTEVVDDYTVRITLHTPFSAFINQLAHPAGVMICPKSLEKYPGKQIAFHPCGTGPYILKDYNPSEILHVVKNPNYWQKGLPKLDGIYFKPVPENSTRVAMLRTGEAQFIFPVPPEQAKTLTGSDNLEVTVSPSIIERYVAFNTKTKPFNDVRVRKALNYAVNKEALAKVAFSGYAVPATGSAPEGVDYAKVYEPWPYDPKKARELLKEAGYPNGFTATLWSLYNHTTAQKVIQFLQQQFAQVGVKVRVRTLEAGERTSFVESTPQPEQSRHELYYIGWSSSTGELDYAVRPVLATSSFPPRGSNESYYSNPAVDQALFYALGTTDREKKSAIYAQMQETIWKDAPWIFLVSEQNIAASSKALHGFYIQPDSSFNFEEASLEPASLMKP